LFHLPCAELCSKNLYRLQVIYHQAVGFGVLAVVIIKSSASACCLINAGFFFGFFFDHEDGGDWFLQNAG
jgi:hypothetical protein